ncbi:MAG: Modification methylase PaeR7I [Bacteroidetes bacterium ADurb.Bin145]|nr:MAG: Modification methylase PaeR7I [Bacteroidetes bacterium ADurb.Bin145]
MVDESLIEFLKYNCNSDTQGFEENLRNLFSYSEDVNPFEEEESKSIIKALNKCKILDPACGSGAFPMGILHKMVHILNKLDPENLYWKQLQKERAIEETNIAYDIEDHEERKRRLDEIEDVFENNISDYGRKLYLIENCIYGIDIQPIAVQIAKLRFFISLIINQNKFEDRENYGIRSLPNLETKFVAANTLISLEKPQLMTGDIFLNDTYQEINKLSSQLKEIRHKYFNAKIREEKLKFQKEDKKLRKEISTLLVKVGHTTINAHKIAAFDPYDQNHFANWFEPEWMFGKDVGNGFSIIIGNPPYINVENLNSEIKKYLFEHYQTCKGRTDIYIAFIELSMKILSVDGILSYIIPYAYTNQNYGSLSRKMLIDRYYIREILDTSEYYVFENAIVKNTIISIVNSSNKGFTNIKIAKSESDFKNNTFTTNHINQREFKDLKDFRFETKDISSALKIKSKIWSKSVRLDEICLIAYGARLNHKSENCGKDIYIFDNYKKGFKPFLEGKNIDRFLYTQHGWLNYCPDEHYNAMFPELFETPKIIFINVVKDKLRFAYDTEKFYNSHTVINCVKWDLIRYAGHVTVRRNISAEKIRKASDYSYLFLLGLLNSKTINWYFNKFLSESLHFYPDDAKELPIPKIEMEKQKEINQIVEKVLSLKKENIDNDTSFFERQIDEFIYNIYDFSTEEKRIIEEQ